MRSIAESLHHKQQAFNQNTLLREFTHIRSIHKALPDNPSIILSQVLMSWYSQRFPTKLLFVAVEQDYDYAPVKLSYSQDMAPEIDAVAPVIPIILQGPYGLEAREWFKESAWFALDDFQYDPVNKKVTMKGAEYMAELHDNWKDSTDFEDLLGDILEDPDDGGVIIDFGDIRIGDKAPREHILNDDLHSAATMGLQDHASFVSGISDSSDPSPTTTTESPISELTTPMSLPLSIDQMFEQLLADPTTFNSLKQAFLTGSEKGTGTEQ